MLDPLDYENRPAIESLARKRRVAFVFLFLEACAHHSWRGISWVLLFCGIWMMQIPQFFGGGAVYSITALFLIGCVYFLRRDIMRIKLPSDAMINERLEARSNLMAGTLPALEDTLANPKKHITRDLWSVSQKQILSGLKNIKYPNLNINIIKNDPYAMRFLAILVFFMGFFIAGQDWKNRIYTGVMPIDFVYNAGENAAVNLWITPPKYTGMAQIHLTEETTAPADRTTANSTLKIPQGSDLKLRAYAPLFGDSIAPVFTNGKTQHTLKALGDGLYGLETKIGEGSTLTLSQLYIPRAAWRYEFIKDLPPTIKTAVKESKDNKDSKEDKKPNDFETLENGHLRFPFSVNDDYGVTDLTLTMSLDPSITDAPLGDVFNEKRLVMSPPQTEFEISPVYDLAWHTWAGLPVVLSFSVIDDLGQVGNLAPLKMTLPERAFENPVAKSLIAARKRLAWSKDYNFIELSTELHSLLAAKDFLKENIVVFLAIKTAAARLQESSDLISGEEKIKTARAVIALLWDAAIALEDGNLSLVMQELKDAQKALEDALRDPSTPEEKIQQLTQDLNDKIQNYFAQLQKEIQKRIAKGEKFPILKPDKNGQIISPNSLKEFLEKMQSELAKGNKDKAQEMLSQLQRMMEMMDPSVMGKSMPPQMQMMSKGINELQELIKRQEELRDQTQTQAELQARSPQLPDILSKILPPNQDVLEEFGLKNMPPPPAPKLPETPKINTQENKAEQESLRYILGQLMMEVGEKLDNVPENMGKAEQDMRASASELGAGNPIGSIPHQESAIKNLKEAQEDLNKQLQQSMQAMIGMGLSGGMNYDPLGRPFGGPDQGGSEAQGSVKIPDEAQKKRTEEILRLLRDRSGEFDRPSEELDYYRRLLRQF